MPTEAEISNALTIAEQALGEQAIPEQRLKDAWEALQPILNEVKNLASVSANYSAAILLRLAKTLRDLGNNYYEEDSHGEAQAILGKALGWYPKDVALLNEQGWLHYDRDYFDKAVVAFRQVIDQINPAPDKDQKASAMRGAGASLSRLRQFVAAEYMFSEAISLMGQATAGILVERGWLRFYQESYDLALADFQSALRDGTAQEKDKHRAMKGQLASLQVLDSRDRSGRPSQTEELAKNWLASGHPEAKVVELLTEAADVLSYLNNYAAALRLYELVIKYAPNNQSAHEMKIYALKWLRRFKQAEDFYKIAQAKFPDNVGLWNEIANTYFQEKRYKKAYDYFSGKAVAEQITPDKREAFLQSVRKNDDAIEWCIVLLRNMNKLDEAKNKVDEALSTSADKVNFLSEQAVIYFLRRDYETAVALFERALEIDEYNEFAHQWRAASLRKQRDFAKAKQELDESLRKLPWVSGLWEERAWLAFDQNQLGEADSYFLKAIKLDPYLIRTQFSRIEVATRLNRSDEALAMFGDLKKQFPKDLEVTEQLGWFYLRRGEFALAKEQFDLIERTDRTNVLGINGLGGYYLEQRDFPAAAAQFRKALEQVDYEPQYYINLAWSLIRQANESIESAKTKNLLREAEAKCRIALEKDPFNAKAYICLGVIAFKRNDFPDAEGYFRRSLELDQIDGGRVELGALYVQTARLDEAKKELSEAINRNTNDARAHFEMANLLLLEDDNKGAARECYQAILLDPKNEEAQLALAIALKRAGRSDEAEKALRSAIKRLPPSKQWQLYLQLAEIAVQLADANNKDGNLYAEALTNVNFARLTHPSPNADISFHFGIVHHRLEDYKTASKDFQECLRLDRDRFDARRYSQIVKALIRQERRISRINVWGGVGIAGFCGLLLLILWTCYFFGWTRTIPAAQARSNTNQVQTDEDQTPDTSAEERAASTSPSDAGNNPKSSDSPNEVLAVPAASPSETEDNPETVNDSVTADTAETEDSTEPDENTKSNTKTTRKLLVDESMLTVMTPLLLGLVVVGLLLPNLNKLKLPGFEAEIGKLQPQETKEPVSSGPKGDIGFGSSLPVLSPGPGGR
ncbi:MAG TPA: hypothetical protein DC047_11075 [Blastocatellia bacterium]|nr:hypothetical protein [Blastocatellia bacterium]